MEYLNRTIALAPLRVVWLVFFPVWYLLYPVVVFFAAILGHVLYNDEEALVTWRRRKKRGSIQLPGLRGVRPYHAWWTDEEYDEYD